MSEQSSWDINWALTCKRLKTSMLKISSVWLYYAKIIELSKYYWLQLMYDNIGPSVKDVMYVYQYWDRQ